ncbi:MAG TPA: TolC family protein [Gemmataceae bacterium]|nr:TolC family protein [Gemmataceae bacterium]
MKWSGNNAWRHFLMLSACLTAGCEVFADPLLHNPPPAAIRPLAVQASPSTAPPRRATFGTPVEQPIQQAAYMPYAQVEPAQRELSARTLVEQVLARNPSLAQMTAVWQAATARYPQVTSLDDPMFGGTIGPASFGSNTVNSAYRLELSQKLPWPGKLGLRGQNALAEASAAGFDVEDMRLQLIESAQSAFYDYFLATRALEVNAEGLRLLQDFKKNAEARYTNAQGAQQDILQADVEIGKQRERGLQLERMRRVSIARINTLLDLQPDLPLPPPPKQLAVKDALQTPATLRAIALANRPDLKALMNRIAAEEASLGLAHKEYYPDVEPFVMYDRFMGNTSDTRDLAIMIGAKVNLPTQTCRRDGAVAEAHAKVAQRRAELARLTDQVNFEVQQAFEQVHESENAIRLYEKEILPAARANVKTAQAEYMTGKIPFLSLIEAQRNFVGLQDRFYETTADYFRRRATLERAVGGPPPVGQAFQPAF